MKLSKLDMFVLGSFIEYTSMNQDVCQLNEKGVKRLADIQARMSANLLNINAKDIRPSCEERLFKHLKYSKT